jgi:hypothetical protein
MLLIEACSCPVYGGKMLRRQRPAAWRRGIWMMRGDINTPLADDPASWSECRSAQQRACRGGETPSPTPDGGVGAVALCRLKSREARQSTELQPSLVLVALAATIKGCGGASGIQHHTTNRAVYSETTRVENPAVSGGVFRFLTGGPTLPGKGDKLVGDELCPVLQRCRILKSE